MPTRHDVFRVIFAGLMLVSLANAIPAAAQASGPLGSLQLAQGTIHRHDTAILDQPMLTLYTLRHLYFSDVQANNNDLVWGSSAKSPTNTANTDVRYVYAFCDTRSDGPIVYELPASAGGTNFFGSFGGTWFVPLVDLGTFSVDTRHGSKFLVLPPGYQGVVPPGYIAVRPATHNVILFNRSVIPKHAADVLRSSDELLKQIKVYPLSTAANPPSQRLVDLSEGSFEALARYDASFYTSLARRLTDYEEQSCCAP